MTERSNRTRRQWLAVCGGATVGLSILAGCMGSDDDPETNNGDDEDDETEETDNGESTETANDSWPMDRFTADNRMVTNDRSGPDGPLEERWTVEVEDVTLSAPVIDHGLVYVADETPTLHAVDLASGELEWTFDAELPPRAPSNPQWDPTTPAVTDDAVYFLTDRLYAIEPDDGEELWSVELGSLYAGDIRVFDGIVYVNNDGELYAIDIADEEIIWEDEASSTQNIAVGDDGTLYVSHQTNRESDYEVLAFDVEAGETLWTYSPAGNVNSGYELIVHDGTVYTHEYDTVLAIDGESGDAETVTVHSEDNDGSVVAGRAPTIADGVVYSAGLFDQQAVFAAELTTGDEPSAWESDELPPGVTGRRIFVSDDTLYVWRDLGYTHLHALDPETGAEQWTTYTLDHIETSLHGSMVEGYAVLEDSVVFTINSNTGQVIVTLDPQ